MRKYCFALDLKPDPELIAAYEDHHTKVWPEVIKSLEAAGIKELEIYRVENRLFMIMVVNMSFSIERKKQLDLANTHVQEWEKLMWKYQQGLPAAKAGEKWIEMKKIFEL